MNQNSVLSKVPELTLIFWIIKTLATTLALLILACIVIFSQLVSKSNH